MKSRYTLPVLLIALGGLVQCLVLQMFAAGQRQAMLTVVVTVSAAVLGAFVGPQRITSKIGRFLICLLLPALGACAALLIGEKFDQPAATLLFRSEWPQLAAMTLVLAAGWLVGLAAFVGVAMRDRVRVDAAPTDHGT